MFSHRWPILLPSNRWGAADNPLDEGGLDGTRREKEHYLLEVKGWLGVGVCCSARWITCNFYMCANQHDQLRNWIQYHSLLQLAMFKTKVLHTWIIIFTPHFHNTGNLRFLLGFVPGSQYSFHIIPDIITLLFRSIPLFIKPMIQHSS